MQGTVFNPIQLHLLQMFSRMNSEQELKEVQQVLSENYLKKVSKRANELWDEMELMRNSNKWQISTNDCHTNESSIRYKLPSSNCFPTCPIQGCLGCFH